MGLHRWLAWNLFFPAQEWGKGHPTLRILREMEQMDRLSTAAFEEIRREKFRNFVKYCYTHVPYIRKQMQEAGLRPIDFHDLDDLARLPLMRKDDVRCHAASLRSNIAGRLATIATSGSTGSPLVVQLSASRVASHVACRQRVSRWWGVSVGDPELALWGPPLVRSYRDWVRAGRDWLFATRFLSAYEMNERTMSRYLDVLGSGRWRHLFGYPSAVHQLCLHARRQGRNLQNSGLRVVFVTGEMLHRAQRELISETLGCPVANGYGGRDSGFVAHECPTGGMHVMADATIVEIVDSEGRPVPVGESGEIVVTDLYSEEAPFLRYATGDLGALSPRQCACGRPLPLLDRLEGRSLDSVLAPDGRIFPGMVLNRVLWSIEGIEQVRVFQKERDRFHVQIVRGTGYRAEDETRIRQGWSDLLGAPLRVTFEYVPELSRERSGKLRFLVSEISQVRILREETTLQSN